MKKSLIDVYLFAVFAALDFGMLYLLPILGVSYGFIWLPFILLLLFRIFITLLFRIFERALRSQPRSSRKSHLLPVILMHLIVTGLCIYSFYIEPMRLTISTINISTPSLRGQKSVRIIHLSDLHMERMTRREEGVLAEVERYKPDLLLLTGDYINQEYLTDPVALESAKIFLQTLHAPLGVFAVMGSVDSPSLMRTLFQGTQIRVLDDAFEKLPISNANIYVLGLRNQGWAQASKSLSVLSRQIPSDAYTILLYHSPNIAIDASESSVDLYLTGHTHGGQIRLPAYGAILTFSRYGKQFEMGLYRVESMDLYVNRGLGMEGLGWPRVRFLCPPEIVELVLQPR